MNIRNVIGTMALVVAAACFAACGGSASSGGDGGEGAMSEDMAIALAAQISDAAVNSVNAGNANIAAMQAKALAGEADKGISCTETSCIFSYDMNYGVNCTVGGRIAVTGRISGTMSNTGTGSVNMQATETITDWECVGDYIINGDPYVSLVGTFTYVNGVPGTRQDMTISGGWKWGTTAEESCQVSLSINFSTGGGGTMSGTVCGYSVNSSF